MNSAGKIQCTLLQDVSELAVLCRVVVHVVRMVLHLLQHLRDIGSGHVASPGTGCSWVVFLRGQKHEIGLCKRVTTPQSKRLESLQGGEARFRCCVYSRHGGLAPACSLAPALPALVPQLPARLRLHFLPLSFNCLLACASTSCPSPSTACAPMPALSALVPCQLGARLLPCPFTPTKYDNNRRRRCNCCCCCSCCCCSRPPTHTLRFCFHALKFATVGCSSMASLFWILAVACSLLRLALTDAISSLVWPMACGGAEGWGGVGWGGGVCSRVPSPICLDLDVVAM